MGGSHFFANLMSTVFFALVTFNVLLYLMNFLDMLVRLYRRSVRVLRGLLYNALQLPKDNYRKVFFSSDELQTPSCETNTSHDSSSNSSWDGNILSAQCQEPHNIPDFFGPSRIHQRS